MYHCAFEILPMSGRVSKMVVWRGRLELRELSSDIWLGRPSVFAILFVNLIRNQINWAIEFITYRESQGIIRELNPLRWTLSSQHCLRSRSNMLGRGLGERITIGPHENNILFFGARGGYGLWKSINSGAAWTNVTSFHDTWMHIPDHPGNVFRTDHPRKALTISWYRQQWCYHREKIEYSVRRFRFYNRYYNFHSSW
jgi:hypothetical protein